MAELAAAGIRLDVDGDRLVARGRRLPPDLADRLRAHKAELIALLTASERPQYPHNTPAGRVEGDIAGFADGNRGSEIVAPLSDADRARLDAEAAPGDVLVRLALASLAEPPAGPVAEAIEDAAVTITRTLRDGGWIVVYSTILGAEVIFTRDAGVSVLEAYAALPRFDRDELAAERPDVEPLRAIVEAKRAMPGSRVVARGTGAPVTPSRVGVPITNTDTTTTPEAAQGDLELLAKRRG